MHGKPITIIKVASLDTSSGELALALPDGTTVTIPIYKWRPGQPLPIAGPHPPQNPPDLHAQA